ncbi:hypothetical protein M426DRAFT_323706 [Hypoxylon sp. CI-4A]|nr:hypothetical protein M426DRAFT_323706 [Hypoxylon sp. CI-4A]
MFTTFVGTGSGAAESGGPASSEPLQPLKPRQKRSQVSRACDWCRVHRIKCDNHLPCSNCRKRGGQCSQGEVEVRTLPHAYRKIERLEKRVRELEQELENERSTKRPRTGLETPRTTPRSLDSPALSSGLDRDNVLTPASRNEGNSERHRLRGGVHVRATRSEQETWYGPSSLFYFIRRVNAFLNSSLPETRPINRMLPDSANKPSNGPTPNPGSTEEQTQQETPAEGGDSVANTDYLTPTQEEYFISLFWQSYHTSVLILDEVAFKEHYQSLWRTSTRTRKPSALVDIVVAICMQYGMALQPGAGQASSTGTSLKTDSNDTTLAGRSYYQRCQRLLGSELECPTIMTIQCHILSTVYLCAGAFPNMADSTCTLAVRTAYMLGLHLEPPPELPQKERELRKRLWWTLYVLDSKTSMKLGRPFLQDLADSTCSLPGDDQENAMLSGSVFPPLGDNATWLTFNVENIRLFLAVRKAYAAFYRKQLNITIDSNDQAPREEAEIIESHAEYLGPYIDRIEDWTKGVPSAIRTKRRDGGVPFSTDFTTLDIEPFASPWLQRQRLLLELMYHNLCLNLLRPFIRFDASTTPTPTADKLAAKCAAHAITLTHIMHQVLSTTTILTGWHESSQWQWNAVMSLIGFVIAYPGNASAPAAREAIDLSVAVFEIFGRSLATAANAASIARDLGAQAEVLIKQTQERLKPTPNPAETQVATAAAGTWGLTDDAGLNSVLEQPAFGTWGYDDGSMAPMQSMLAESMDMAFSVDSRDFGMLLWPDMSNSPTDQWMYM